MAKREYTTIRTPDELGQVLGEYAEATLERERLENEIEIRCARIREECRARMEGLRATQESLLSDMAAYARLHPELFPEGRKSVELAHGTVGFRTGTPRVGFRRGTAEEDVLAALGEEDSAVFSRVRRELDREAVLKAWSEGGAPARRLEDCGIRVSQAERFFAEIKREGE